MSKKQIKEIEQIKNVIIDKYKPEKIILFGSFAWGKPSKDSDVDLVVVKETKKNILDRRREIAKKLFGNNFPAVDILVYTPREFKERLYLKDPFLKEVVDNGKVLYAK